MKKQIKYTFFLTVTLFALVQFSDNVYAAPSCSVSNRDTSQWEYLSSQTYSSSAGLKMGITKSGDSVINCCQLGGGPTQRWVCDTYKVTTPSTPDAGEEENSNENDNNNSTPSQTKPSCSGGIDETKWKYLGSDTYFSSAGLKLGKTEGATTLKNCCQLGANQTQRWVCDNYEVILDENGNGNKIDGNVDTNEENSVTCDTENGKYVFDYSKTESSDLTGVSGNTKICCEQNPGSDYLTGGNATYKCSYYVSGKLIEEGYKPGDPTFEVTDTVGDCGVLSDILPEIETILDYIKIAAPIMLIVFGCIDFTMPIISNDKDALQKAGSKFMKRCIVTIAIFFAAPVIEWLLKLLNDATATTTDTSLCNLGMIFFKF